MAWSVALGLISGEPSDSEGFSLDRYEPMSRLLAEDDFVFLAAQPGYRPEMGAKLRRERRRIFRLYLRELAQDFGSLHREARAMVAESQAEQSELVGLLIRQRLVFLSAMTMVQLRLAASRFSLGNVDVRGLLESIEAMRLDVARLMPAPATQAL